MPISPDPELTEHASAIEQQIERAARRLTPKEFENLIGVPGRAVLRSLKEALEADALSIWLADPERKHLVVTHTEPDPDFVGFEQPLTEGLVSLAFASEQCLCENQVYLNENHSKRVDEARGQVTCAMIATPYYIAGHLRGVISCVQMKDSPDAPDPSGFRARNMNRVRRTSTVIERLVNYRLLTSLLELEL
ncbi:MAG: GAF domain-containing protein [Verrucomicrobiota bacterium]